MSGTRLRVARSLRAIGSLVVLFALVVLGRSGSDTDVLNRIDAGQMHTVVETQQAGIIDDIIDAIDEFLGGEDPDNPDDDTPPPPP
ncbi:MAG: hypothetical protein AAFR38_13605 [Planctomycetota bacterium]